MLPFRKSRESRNRFRPTIEGLEDRVTPAGNITAVVRGGALFLTGDGAANQINVIGNTRGTIDIITRDSNTIINNQPGMVTLMGFKGSIIADMAGGDDVINIQKVTISGRLSIETGEGNDAVFLENSTLRNDFSIHTGNGDDLITLGGNRHRGTPYINAGEGDNQVNVLFSKFERGAFFVAGGGNDSFGSTGSKFQNGSTMNGFEQRATAALPRTGQDTATVAKGQSVTINVTSNDVPVAGTLVPSSVAITTQPLFGTVSVNASGVVTYTHNGSTSSGVDTFRYTVKNSGGGVSDAGLVKINITGIPGPSVALTTSVTSPTKTTPIPFTATFSEDVTGFTAADISVSNGTVANLTPTSGKTYTFTVTPTNQGAVSVSIPAGGAQNAAGLDNTASTSTSITFDSQAPTITITPLTTNDTTPTLTGTISDSTATVKVTVNGTEFTATISGNTWTANVTTTLAAGTYPVTATATDPAGNVATATNATGLVVDLTAPSLTITPTPPSATAIGFNVSFVFSKAVTGFTASDITVEGIVNNLTTTDNKTFTATISPTATGILSINVAAGVATDSAGNGNTAGTANVTVGNTLTVAVTAAPTNPTATGPIPFTATFAEDVTGFASGDITVTNGTVSNFVATNAKVYTFTVTPTAAGAVTVSIPVSAAQNGANTNNLASKPFTIVTTASGLNFIDQLIGTGATAATGQLVEVKYTGRLVDGTQFDTGTIQFTPGSSTPINVIEGWDEGIPGMKVGGKRQLIIPSNLGYGAAGSPPNIPANAVLIFDVELLRIV